MGCDGVQESRPTGARQGRVCGERAPESHSHSLLWVRHRAPRTQEARKPDAAKFLRMRLNVGSDLKYRTGFLRRPLAHELQNQKPFLQFLFVCPAEPASGPRAGRLLGLEAVDGLHRQETPQPGVSGPQACGLWWVFREMEAAPQDSRKQMDLGARWRGHALEPPYSSRPQAPPVSPGNVSHSSLSYRRVGASGHPMALST